MSKRGRRIPARQLLRPPAPVVASLVTGPSAAAFASGKKSAKTVQKAVKKFSKGASLGYLGKEGPAQESNEGVAAPGMYDAQPVRRLSDPEESEREGGARLRDPLEETPKTRTDPNLLPEDS
jgi:hypothetical protein